MINVSFIDDFLKRSQFKFTTDKVGTAGFFKTNQPSYQELRPIRSTSISSSETVSPLNLIIKASSRLSMKPFPSWLNLNQFIILYSLYSHCRTLWMLPECPPPDSDPEPSSSSSSETQESRWNPSRLCRQCLSGPEWFIEFYNKKYRVSQKKGR